MRVIRWYLTSIMATAGVFPNFNQNSLVWIPAMARFLVVLGLVILLVGLLWPYLARIGLGAAARRLRDLAGIM